MIQKAQQIVTISAKASIGNDRNPAIALVPYYLKFKGKLADVSLDDLEWPIGRPDGLQAVKVGDLGTGDHLFTYPRRWVYGRKTRGLAANLSLMIVEPRSFHGHHMRLMRWFHRRFYRVLTCDPELMKTLPNAQFFVFGDTWVPDWPNKQKSKTKMLSLIASRKKALKGHKLRHKIVRALKASNTDIDVMGGGYQYFEDKADGLAIYRYSIVIENTREPNYFTEKLLDAMLLKTVPIYWGAQDIGDYFNLDGMIICETEADIVQAVAEISSKDYQSRQAALDANQQAAVKFSSVEKGAARVLRSTL